MRVSEILSQASSFGDLLTIAENTTPQISFFGDKYISVSSYTGTLYIDALAEYATKLIEENLDFAEEVRPILKDLSGRIDKIYEESDQIVKASNLLTRIFYAIRKFIGDTIDYGKNVRVYWETDGSETYKFYTKEQYQKVFEHVPRSKPHRRLIGFASRGYYSPDVCSKRNEELGI